MPDTRNARIGDYRSRGYLTHLQLRNFRAFESEEIKLAPITIIVGPNNAGKSSILSALRVLSQTLQSVDPEVPLLLGEFGTYRDVVYKNKATKSFGIRLGMQFGDKSQAFEVNFRYRAQRREIIQQDFVAYEDGQRTLRTVYSRDVGRQSVDWVAAAAAPAMRQIKVRFFHFLPRVMHLQYEFPRFPRTPTSKPQFLATLREIDNFLLEVSRTLSRLQYLGPFRDAPLRAYPFSGERPSTLTVGGKGATDILVADFFRRGTQKKALSIMVQAWLAKAQIARAVDVRALSDRQYDIRLQHPTTGELENLADVGYGISQVLPVLVAGYNMQPGSVFVVEQPELHLHPRAQFELGDFLYQLHRRRVQSIVETHSEHLILRLQGLVGEGLIAPEDIAVNFVCAEEDRKRVVLLPLNEDGIFTRKWPHGFFEERLEEALRLARAPLKRKAKQRG